MAESNEESHYTDAESDEKHKARNVMQGQHQQAWSKPHHQLCNVDVCLDHSDAKNQEP